jgi:hypothetical protein
VARAGQVGKAGMHSAPAPADTLGPSEIFPER